MKKKFNSKCAIGEPLYRDPYCDDPYCDSYYDAKSDSVRYGSTFGEHSFQGRPTDEESLDSFRKRSTKRAYDPFNPPKPRVKSSSEE